MEGLVRLAFYLFAASTIALVASTICYLIYAFGWMRGRSATLVTPEGLSVSTANAPRLSEAFGRYATMLAWFSVIFQGLSILCRSIAAGRLPLSNMYEFSKTFVFLVVLLYLLFERWYGVKQVGTIVMPIALAMAGYVWSLPASLREVDPLIPALQNVPLMTVHVSMGILAYATFAVSFAAAVLYLVTEGRSIGWLPSPDLLDDLGYRAVTIGFPALTLMLILGSVWAYQAWGSYWSWDPKESAALFTWLIYAVYLHSRSLRGWRGRRSAWILIFGFGATMFTYYGNYIFGGMHAYGGVN
jgi:cytochrome c-type biogenesis protein CcsB